MRDRDFQEIRTYESARDSPDTNNPADEANRDTRDIFAAFASGAQGVLLSGSCVPSFSISALGRSYSVDLGQFCQAMTIAGYIVLALASIIAVRVFVGDG